MCPPWNRGLTHSASPRNDGLDGLFYLSVAKQTVKLQWLSMLVAVLVVFWSDPPKKKRERPVASPIVQIWSEIHASQAFVRHPYIFWNSRCAALRLASRSSASFCRWTPLALFWLSSIRKRERIRLVNRVNKNTSTTMSRDSPGLAGAAFLQRTRRAIPSD